MADVVAAAGTASREIDGKPLVGVAAIDVALTSPAASCIVGSLATAGGVAPAVLFIDTLSVRTLAAPDDAGFARRSTRVPIAASRAVTESSPTVLVFVESLAVTNALEVTDARSIDGVGVGAADAGEEVANADGSSSSAAAATTSLDVLTGVASEVAGSSSGTAITDA
jgi:hypothetical protein